MSTQVLNFPKTKLSDSDFKSLRLKNGLSHIQIANCLGVSVSTIESWEQGRRRITLDISDIENRIIEYFHNGRNVEDRNILFGVISVPAGRHILDMTCEEVASRFGIKAETWRKYEQDREKMPQKIKENFEKEISSVISKIQCSVSF